MLSFNNFFFKFSKFASYLYEVVNFNNKTLFSFGLRLFILSELLIFLTLILSYYYSLCNLAPCFDIFLFHSSFIFDSINFYLGQYFLIFLLSFLLFSIKNTCYIISSFVINNNSILSFFDYINFVLNISLIFIFIQFFEFFSQSFCIFDSSFGVFFYEILGLHCFHVFLGTIFTIYGFKRL